MGRKSTKKNKGGSHKRPPKRRSHQPKPSPPPPPLLSHYTSSNFVPSAGPGCYIAQRNSPVVSDSWIIGWEDVDPLEFYGGDEEDEADLAVDTEERTLTLCNTSANVHKVAYVTVLSPAVVRGGNGEILERGSATGEDGVSTGCITFIILCPPAVFVHLCYLDVPDGTDFCDAVKIESDVSEWRRHPNPNDEHPRSVGFPLATTSEVMGDDGVGSGDEDDETSGEAYVALPQSSYLCTQGEGGELTHFFDGNLHAVDFACPIGTPLLAVGDGVVHEVKVDYKNVTGIRVSNLFHWNSLILCLDDEDAAENRGNNGAYGDGNESSADVSNRPSNQQYHPQQPLLPSPSSASKRGPLYVEYVHIQTAHVRPGERVRCGQIIGTSGSVGFSPEPHLHFSAFRSSEPTAPTVRVRFRSGDGKGGTFLPTAGNWYGADGPVDPASLPSASSVSSSRTLTRSREE